MLKYHSSTNPPRYSDMAGKLLSLPSLGSVGTPGPHTYDTKNSLKDMRREGDEEMRRRLELDKGISRREEMLLILSG